MTRVGRSRRCRGAGGDAGSTLLEVLVALAIMSGVGALATAGIMQMRASVSRNESLSEVASQLHVAFQRLDREVRYASGVRDPSQARSAQGWLYVEYELVSGGVTRCVQLRVGGAGGALQRRAKVGAAAAGPWSTLTTGLGAGARFSKQDASTAQYPHQQLTVALPAEAGAGSHRTGRQADYTFTALNTSAETAAAVCTALDRP